MTPPCGISEANMKCVLTQVQPYWSLAAVAIPFVIFWVQTDDANPYGESFAHPIASSTSENGVTDTTGPKTSFWTISSSWLAPATTVGS